MTEMNTTTYVCDRCNRKETLEANNSILPGRVKKAGRPKEWNKHTNEPHEMSDPLFCGNCQVEFEQGYAQWFAGFMKSRREKA